MEKKAQILKLYLDEDVTPLLAEVLRSRGFDAVSAHEAGKRSVSDEFQLFEATRQGRILVTHNIRDFVRLHQKLGIKHGGILAASQQSFSSLLRKTIRFLNEEQRADPSGLFFWLSNY